MKSPPPIQMPDGHPARPLQAPTIKQQRPNERKLSLCMVIASWLSVGRPGGHQPVVPISLTRNSRRRVLSEFALLILRSVNDKRTHRPEISPRPRFLDSGPTTATDDPRVTIHAHASDQPPPALRFALLFFPVSWTMAFLPAIPPSPPAIPNLGEISMRGTRAFLLCSAFSTVFVSAGSGSRLGDRCPINFTNQIVHFYQAELQ